jgi:hypothetical protein
VEINVLILIRIKIIAGNAERYVQVLMRFVLMEFAHNLSVTHLAKLERAVVVMFAWIS